MLSSRPTAPNALVLLAGPQPAAYWNSRFVPAFPGFSDADAQTIFDIAKSAFAPWLLDVTTDSATKKPHGTIGFTRLFGGYPISGGQANVASFDTPGVNAYVFVDQLDNLAWAIGRDGVHEAGHLIGFPDLIDASGYIPGFWMGTPFVGTPAWTIPQRDIMDARFGPCPDLNFDGVVNVQDAKILRDGQYTAAEAIAVARGFGSKI